MKKLLLILLYLPLIFSSCEEEDKSPTNNAGNNNLSLTLEATKWEVTMMQESDISGQTETSITIPCSPLQGWNSGINKIEWTFFNNEGFFIEKFIDGNNNAYYDTSNYCYDCFPYNNKITLNYNPQGGYSDILDGSYQPEFLNIIEHSSSNLIVEFCDAPSLNNCCKVFLTKIH